MITYIITFWMALLPRVHELALAAQVLSPQLSDELAYENAVAVVFSETADVPGELLLSLARTESSFDPSWTSRLMPEGRVIGRWHKPMRPPGSTGNLYCGLTQAKARTWEHCLRLRVAHVAYAQTVDELGYWLGRCERRRDVWACALSGYGQGNKGAERGTSGYARRVMARWRRLVRLASPGVS